MSMPIDTKVATRIKDTAGIIIFVAAVFIGAWVINMFVFKSFNVEGPSMKNTMHSEDRLIVNRLPITWSRLRGVNYVPERGQIIVFKNPNWEPGQVNEYVVKRVVGLPGERVAVANSKVTVYNSEHPEGIDIDTVFPGALQPTEPSLDRTVPEGRIFVLGDNRPDSCDSRACLGMIPLDDVVGPVSLRIFPLNLIRTF